MSPSSDESRRSSAASSLERAGDGFVARLERRVAPYAERFAQAPAVKALGEALPVAFGSLLAALIVLVLAARPAHLAAVPALLRDAIPSGFAIASVVMVFVLSFRLARRLRYPAAPMVLAALAAFALALPREALRALADIGATGGLGAFAKTLGAAGLFTAIVVSLATALCFTLARTKLGAARGNVAGALAIVALSALLYAAHISIAAVLAALLAPLATLGDSFGALVAITAIEAALWVVGIHGPAMLAAIVLPLYTDLQFQNTAAAHAHQPLPHLVVVTTFLFVFPGGAGATLPLVLLLLRSRVPRLRTFAYATLVPSLLNTNEPVIFGLPLAFNPILAVPFVLAPVALACTTYAALALHLVRAPAYYIPSSVPVFVNVFIGTLDWRACVLLALNLLVSGAIWLPFVRVFERTRAVQA